MWRRILRKGRELRHLQTAREVLNTPPIVPTADRLLLYSMIGTRVVLPYLVAVKALHAQLGIGRVAILDDGSLTADDKMLLAHHCGNPQITPIGTIETGACPRGGTWERLVHLLALRRDDYVIQLDSDTVTLGPVPDVLAAVADNRSFTLLGDDARPALPLTLPEFTAGRYPDGPLGEGEHIQVTIESRFGQYPDAASFRYVRGCSGFTGFARGGPGGLAELEQFSRAGEALVGSGRWREWGTEQVASSFLLANEPGMMTLPYGRYANYWNEVPGDDVRFLHFVGTHRYAKGEYRRRTRETIRQLSRNPASATAAA